jgi:hypothetical protein
MPVGDTPDSLDYCPPRRQLDVVQKLNGTGKRRELGWR